MIRYARNIFAALLAMLALSAGVAVVCQQITAAQVRLTGLKKVYKADEKVVFKLTNTSKHPTAIVNFTAEVFREGHWYECTEDIRGRIFRKEILVSELGAGKTKMFHFSTKQDMYLDSPAGRKPTTEDRKYRFVFDCNVTITSPVFVVQKPVIHRK